MRTPKKSGVLGALGASGGFLMRPNTAQRGPGQSRFYASGGVGKCAASTDGAACRTARCRGAGPVGYGAADAVSRRGARAEGRRGQGRARADSWRAHRGKRGAQDSGEQLYRARTAGRARRGARAARSSHLPVSAAAHVARPVRAPVAGLERARYRSAGRRAKPGPFGHGAVPERRRRVRARRAGPAGGRGAVRDRELREYLRAERDVERSDLRLRAAALQRFRRCFGQPARARSFRSRRSGSRCAPTRRRCSTIGCAPAGGSRLPRNRSSARRRV